MHRTRTRVLAAAAAAVATSLAMASTATAGTYTIDQCRQEGTSIPKRVVSEWTADGAGRYDTCSTGGSFGYHLDQAPAGQVPYGGAKWLNLRVPDAAPGVTIERLKIAYRFPSHSGNSAFLRFYGNGTQLFDEELPTDHVAAPLELAMPSGSVSVWIRHFCTTSPYGATNCSYASPFEVFKVVQARLTLRESGLPSATIDGGSLTGTGAKSGIRSLAYSATDAASGIERIRVRLGSTTVSELSYAADAAACPRDTWAACERDRSGQSVDLDTTQVPDGTHELSLVVDDAAGNSRTISGGDVIVDNVPPPALRDGSRPRVEGSPAVGAQLAAQPGDWTGENVQHAYQWERCDADGGSCVEVGTGSDRTYIVSSRDAGHRLRVRVTGSNGEGSNVGHSDVTPVIATSSGADPSRTPVPTQGSQPGGLPDRGPANGDNASDRARLSAFFGRQRRTTLRLRYGRSARISGRLVDPTSQPISGATLTVLAEPRVRGAQIDDLGVVRTGRDGRFSYTVSAGPSRLIRIGYRSHVNDTQFADTTEVLVLVRAGVTLRPRPRKLRNGNTATFAGRAVQPIPLRGVLVDLQVRVGKQWRTFGVVRTSRSGRYRYRHRFRNTFVRTVYRFRARVHRESDYPYIVGYSRIAKLKVRP